MKIYSTIFKISMILALLCVNSLFSQQPTGVSQTSGTNDDLSSVYFPAAKTGFAVGVNGTIRKTTNGGTNWTGLTSGTTQDLYEVYFLNVSTGYVSGTNGTIRKTGAFDGIRP